MFGAQRGCEESRACGSSCRPDWAGRLQGQKEMLPGNEVDLLKHGVFNHQTDQTWGCTKKPGALNQKLFARGQNTRLRDSRLTGFFATTFSSTQLLTQTQRGVLAMAIHHIPIGGSE
jgi:hypothetical protein